MTLLARDPRAPLTLQPAALSRMRRAPRMDRVLLLATALLALLGALLVWSATRTLLVRDGRNPQTYLLRHLFNCLLGAVLLLAASRVDARLLRWLGPALYAGSLLGLAAVFLVGSTVNGAHAWIRLGGGFELQPSEFAKLGVIAGTAVMFAQRRAERRTAVPTSRDVLIAIGLIAVPLALIMLEPDLGSAMVLITAAFGVLAAAGTRARWTIGLTVLGVLGVVLAIRAGVLEQYQLDRFRAFTNPLHDVQGASYNVTQAHIAIVDGGWWGTGLFHGPQTSGAYVPEQQTDFVYSVAGEELGFVGALGIIALFGVLCWRGLRIAAAADLTGRVLAAGVVCWIAFQAFQNIGMNLGLTPVTGLPLPFVSYGGSSMFAQCLAIGLLQAVHRGSGTYA